MNKNHLWPCDICHAICSSVLSQCYPLLVPTARKMWAIAGSVLPHREQGKGRHQEMSSSPSCCSKSCAIENRKNHDKSVCLPRPTVFPSRTLLNPSLSKAYWWPPPSGFQSELEEALEWLPKLPKTLPVWTRSHSCLTHVVSQQCECRFFPRNAQHPWQVMDDTMLVFLLSPWTAC